MPVKKGREWLLRELWDFVRNVALGYMVIDIIKTFIK